MTCTGVTSLLPYLSIVAIYVLPQIQILYMAFDAILADLQTMPERRVITSCNTVVLTSAGMGRANGSHTEKNVRECTLVCSAMIQFSKQKLIRSNHHPATTLKRLLGCVDAGRSCDQAIKPCLGIFVLLLVLSIQQIGSIKQRE